MTDDVLRAPAVLDVGRRGPRLGQADDAIDYYRTATSLFGAATDTRVAATRALTRLHAQ